MGEGGAPGFVSASGVDVATLRMLLWPRVRSLRNAFVMGDRKLLYGGFAVLGLLFWLGLFGLMVLLVDRFYAVEGFGPFLARKLLEMLLASLFVMLAFSNIITALSTFFLSEDLELLLSLPVSRPTFHYARFLDTLAQSSWMMGLFGVPVFIAYGVVIGAGWTYYVALAVAVPCFLIIQGATGVILATILVNVFPARRTRELFVLLGVVMVVMLFVLMRSLRPERLVDAQQFSTLAAYVADLQLPAPLLFPPRWASELLVATLMHAPVPWLEAGLLVSGAAAALALARWATAWGFDGGWVRSQEARSARLYRSGAFDLVAGFAPRAWRGLLAKELRVFVRDPAQWSQVFLLGGLCAIYLVSVQALPMDAFAGQALRVVKDAITFLNLGMGGFVMAAIAARFQFTALSREGRSFWILRAAPVNPLHLLHAKGALGLVPMLIVGEIVTVGSGIMLGARVEVLVLEAVTAVGLALAISGLALAMGAWWPDFRAENAARAASSPAAVLFMVMAQVLVLVVMSLEVAAIWLWLSGRFPAWVGALPIGLVAGICGAMFYWPPRAAVRALWSRGL